MKDQIAKLVIEYYSRYPEDMRNDILHTQEVVCYTRLIALEEKIPEFEIELLECAAWLHDIGCPRSKQIYGNSLPANQQHVGRIVCEEILKQVDELCETEKKWLEDVVGNHHQLNKSHELGFAPLFEADLIVNILSGYHPREKSDMLYKTMISTESGRNLFNLLIK